MDRLTYCSYVVAREVLSQLAAKNLENARDSQEDGADLTDARVLLSAEKMIEEAMPEGIPDE